MNKSVGVSEEEEEVTGREKGKGDQLTTADTKDQRKKKEKGKRKENDVVQSSIVPCSFYVCVFVDCAHCPFIPYPLSVTFGLFTPVLMFPSYPSLSPS